MFTFNFFSNPTNTDLTVILGNIVPTMGVNMFLNNLFRTVFVRMPASATVYGTVPTDTTTQNWGNAFRGMGWDGTSYVSGTVNGNITLVYQMY